MNGASVGEEMRKEETRVSCKEKTKQDDGLLFIEQVTSETYPGAS